MGMVKIIEHSEQAFSNRNQAGELLASHLEEYRGLDCVVMGIPRGGVIVAHQIAQALNMPMDVVIARKLGAPGNPELAIGAISEDGKLFIHNEVVQFTSASEEYIEHEKNRQLVIVNHRLESYRSILPKADLSGKIVIITDDGIATGATMQAAIWAVRGENPSRIVIALPVGPEDSINLISEFVDEVICLRTSSYFYAIGQFYVDFAQVEEDQVKQVLSEHVVKQY